MATRPSAKPVVKTSAKPVAKTSAKPEKPVIKIIPMKEKLTATQLHDYIANATGLERKQVKAVFASLEEVMLASLCKKGLGEFLLPSLLKIVTIAKPATKSRVGISPFSGEETVFKAKPATIRVKVRPMKKLKDAALV